MRQEFNDVSDQLIHASIKHTHQHIDCSTVRHWKQYPSGKVLQCIRYPNYWRSLEHGLELPHTRILIILTPQFSYAASITSYVRMRPRSTGWFRRNLQYLGKW